MATSKMGRGVAGIPSFYHRNLPAVRPPRFRSFGHFPQRDLAITVALPVAEEGQSQNANVTYSGESETISMVMARASSFSNAA